MVSIFKDNGRVTRPQVLGNTFKMAISILVILLIGLKMGKVKSILIMEIDIKEIILMDYLMDMENIFGVVEPNFKDILRRGCVVVKEFGKDQRKYQPIFIKEIMKEIKKMGMEFTNGQMVMNIGVSLLMIINMVMEK